MSETKRYAAMAYLMTTPDGIALADAEPRTVVLASDYDRDLAEMRRQRDEAAALLKAEQARLDFMLDNERGVDLYNLLAPCSFDACMNRDKSGLRQAIDAALTPKEPHDG